MSDTEEWDLRDAFEKQHAELSSLRAENAELKERLSCYADTAYRLDTENAVLRAELAECTKVQCVQHIAELTAQHEELATCIRELEAERDDAIARAVRAEAKGAQLEADLRWYLDNAEATLLAPPALDPR